MKQHEVLLAKPSVLSVSGSYHFWSVIKAVYSKSTPIRVRENLSHALADLRSSVSVYLPIRSVLVSSRVFLQGGALENQSNIGRLLRIQLASAFALTPERLLCVLDDDTDDLASLKLRQVENAT